VHDSALTNQENLVQPSYPDQSEDMVQSPTSINASVGVHTSKNTSPFNIKGGPLSLQHPIIQPHHPTHWQEIPLPTHLPPPTIIINSPYISQ